MKINQLIEVNVPKVNMEGIARVKVQNEVVLIKDVVEKEKVTIKLVKRINEGWVGEVVKVLTPSNYRQKNPCAIASLCGGCSYYHMTYESQLILKKQQIIDLVKESGYTQLKVHDVVGMNEPCAYRNKIIMSFARNKQRVTKMGFYGENSHEIVDVNECLNHEPFVNDLCRTIKRLVSKFKIEIYDEDRRTGLLRHVLIRRGFVSNQTLVCFVLSNKLFPAGKSMVKELLKAHPEVTSVVVNVNNRKTSIVLGDEEKVLYGKGYIQDELCGLKYAISTKSFYQINHEQTEKLYAKAIELMNLKGNEVVYDMYCGIGTIGLSAAKSALEVVGVEINTKAIEDAKKNAQYNQIKNARFYAEDASTFMNKAAHMSKRVDAVFIDPPRSGSDEVFLKALCQMKPKQIVYISCNPVTQMRDLRTLFQAGYKATDCYLYDMFPQTSHIESVVLLTK